MYLKSRKNNIIMHSRNLEFKKTYFNKNKIWELEAEEVFREQMQSKIDRILIILCLIHLINLLINILTMNKDHRLEEFKVKKEKLEQEEVKEPKKYRKKIVQLYVILI